jgi:hypothetical protein
MTPLLSFITFMLTCGAIAPTRHIFICNLLLFLTLVSFYGLKRDNHLDRLVKMVIA